MPLLGSLALDDYTKTFIGKCAECRQRFSYTKYHRYVRQDKNKRLVYCSYTCFRVRAKEDEEKARLEFEKECAKADAKEARDRAYFMRKRGEMGRKDMPVLITKEEAESFLEKAKEKVAKYGREWLGAEPGSHERMAARKNLTCWERKYEHAKKKLAQLEQEQ